MYHIGQPIAWCISDKESIDVLNVFISSFHQRSPDAKVLTVMTDDGEYDHIQKHTI